MRTSSFCKLTGRFKGSVWARGVLSKKWFCLRKFSGPNLIVLAALNDLESVYFAGGSQKTTWYMFPINASGFSTFSTNDTMGSHTGWTEVTTGYSEATRPAWTPGAPSGGIITNPSPVVFTVTGGSVTFHGAGIVSNNTKGGTTGQLWNCGALSGSDQTLNPGQTLRLSYTLTATSG